jgi:DNA polymerase-3 subunit gamma/tau
VAYVVLARKYRPQRFADLVGQEHVTRTLANAIAHNRVHHAYLFCGARGLGKTTAARLLAKCLVCVKGPTIDPCNVCNECTAVTEGRSVDVIEIDGASNNKVEDVRGIRDQVRYLPQTARRKIYIIDEVHMLTGSAFNALLKTLEEPPEHVTFIFATTEVHELPATILSRVSRFDFRRLSSAQLVGHLQWILGNEGVKVEEAGLYTIARAGDGSVRDSLTLLDKVIAFASDTQQVSAEEVRVVLGVPSTLAVAGLVEAVLARDAALTLRRFDEVFASGQDLLALSLEFLKHLRDLMIVKLCGTREALVDTSDADFEQLRAQAAGVESVVLAQLFDRFTRVVDALPKTRVPRLVLEMGLLDLVQSEPLMPLGDLIDRLEQISGGAPVGGGNSAQRGGSGGFRPAPAAEAPRRAEMPPQPVAPIRTAAAPPAGPAPTSAAPAVDRSSPFSKILGSLLTGNSDPEPVVRSPESPQPASPRPADAVARPRPAEAVEPRATPAIAAPWEPAAGGAAAPREIAVVAAPLRSVEAVEPTRVVQPRPAPEAAPLADTPSRSASDCGGGCPGSPQADAPGVIPWASMPALAAWELFLERIRANEAGLFAFLSDLGLAKLGDGVVSLAGAARQFARGHLKDQAAMRAQVESLLQLELGAPFKLELVEGEPSLPDLPSLKLLEIQRAEALQAAVEREAQASPEIQALMAQFDAKVRTVRPRGAPQAPGAR